MATERRPEVVESSDGSARNVWRRACATVLVHIAIVCVLCFALSYVVPHMQQAMMELMEEETRLPEYAQTIFDVTHHIQIHFWLYFFVVAGLAIDLGICVRLLKRPTKRGIIGWTATVLIVGVAIVIASIIALSVAKGQLGTPS